MPGRCPNCEKMQTLCPSTPLSSESLALGWPSCLWVVAATALLVSEASKLTLGQHLDVNPSSGTICAGSQRTSLVDWSKVNKISGPPNGHLNITLKVCQTLNPATLLPVVESGDLLCQCIETIEQTCSSRSDLLDEPSDSPEVEWFTDGSTFVLIEMGT